jgi:hypothetical protein
MYRLPLVVLAAALAACAEGEPLGCSDSAACDAGYICRERECKKLCIGDDECSTGFICAEGVCATGERLSPTITRILGNSSIQCPGAEGNVCFEDGLVIEGSNFTSDSVFSLAGAATLGLEIVRVEGTRADVLLPLSLEQGDYTLSVTNAAGSTQASVTILQGVPGPDATGTELLTRINQNTTTGTLATARLPAANALIGHLNAGDGSVKLDARILPAGSGGGAMSGTEIVTAANDAGTTGRFVVGRMPNGDDLIAHLNSSGTGGVKLNANLVNVTGGTMTGTQIVTALNDAGTTGRVAEDRLAVGRYHVQLTTTSPVTPGNSTPVDDQMILGLCGDGDGCNISIGMSYWDQGFGVSTATLFGQPCRFHINRSTRGWLVAPWCSTRFEATECHTAGCNTPGTDINNNNPYDASTNPLGPTYGFRQYQSGQQGVDGTNSDGATAAGATGWRVLNYYGACVLSEFRVASNVEQSDEGDGGFHFWMQNTTTNPGLDSGWNGRAARTCDLVISD